MVERRRAYLWIEGYSCTPSEVSAALDRAPTSVWIAGETVLSNGRVATRNVWCFESGRGTDAPLDQHIADLVEQFKDRLPLLRDRIGPFTAGLNCVDEFVEFQGNGFHLSAELIRQLAGLGLDVDFDLYGCRD